MGRKDTDSYSEDEESTSHNEHCDKKLCHKYEKKPWNDCKFFFGRDGRDGKDGEDGKKGKDGKCGKRGKTGKDGAVGKDGVPGKDGADGVNGKDGLDGADGKDGLDGKDGKDGKDGITVYANFYGLQPLNQIPVVTPGSPVEFPNNGPTTGNITRLTAGTFNVDLSGNYLISFNLTVIEAAEVVLVLNGVELPETVVARSTGETQLSGNFIINVPQSNSVISLNNASNTPFNLSSNSNTGSTKPLSLQLNILKL
jgi:hypothetical protein